MRNKVLEFLKNNAPVSLTIISAYGYFCVYIFEYGYFKYFNLPPNFIEVQLNEVLAFIFSLVLIISGLIFWIDKLLLIDTSYGARRFLINTALKTIGLGLMVFFLVINITDFSLITYEILLIIIVVLCIGITFWEYLFTRKLKKVKEKLENDFIEEATDFLKKNPSATFDEVKEEIKQKLLARQKPPTNKQSTKDRKPFSELVDLISLAIAILLICFGLGYSDASRLKSFVGFRKHSTIFILKKYGETMICKNYNFKTKEFGDSILVYKTSDTSNNVLIEKRIK
ncbi:MAG TPA: hypothetical protein VGI43_19030 [Mucilaginibacter sp.]|jgi:hypothetical protein